MKQLVIDQIYKRRQIIKFLISGSTAAGTNFIILFILVDLVHIWYLLASGISFLISFFVSFSLQKFWTFRNKETDAIQKQAVMYFMVTIFGLLSNLLFMYIFVDILHWWYMFAQFVISAVIAVFNYIVYKSIIFKKPLTNITD